MTKELTDLIDWYNKDKKIIKFSLKEDAARRQVLWKKRREEYTSDERKVFTEADGSFDNRTARNVFQNESLGLPAGGDTETYDGIFSYGDAADPIWELIESKKISPHKGKVILQTAKRQYKAEGKSKKVKEYVEAILLNGIEENRFRKGGQGNKVKSIRSKKHQNRKDLESSIKELIEKELKDAEPALVREAISWAEGFARAVAHDVNRKIDNFKNRIGNNTISLKGYGEEITTKELEKASKILHVDIPRPRTTMNMNKAKSNRIKLIEQYHQDKNQDKSPEIIREYNSMVNDINLAWEIAQKHYKQVTGKEYR